MSEIKEQKLPTSFSGDIYVKIEFKSLDIDHIYKNMFFWLHWSYKKIYTALLFLSMCWLMFIQKKFPYVTFPMTAYDLNLNIFRRLSSSVSTPTSASLEDDLWWKTTIDERRSLTKYTLWRKTPFDGRWPLMEENLWWKTTFDGRQPVTEDNLLTEDDLWQKTTFDGRLPFDRRQPVVEDDLWRKRTFDGTQLLMKDKPFVTAYFLP